MEYDACLSEERPRACSEAIDFRPAKEGKPFPIAFHALLAERLIRIPLPPLAFAYDMRLLLLPPPLGYEYMYRRPPSEGKRLLPESRSPLLTSFQCHPFVPSLATA